MSRFIQLRKGRREAQRHLKETFYNLTGATTLASLREQFNAQNNNELYEALELVNNELYLIKQKANKQEEQAMNTQTQRSRTASIREMNAERRQLLSNYNIDLPQPNGERPTRRPYDVLISITTKVIWNNDDKEHPYPGEFITTKTFIASSVENLNEQIQKFVEDQYPMYDSERTIYLD
jgi:hypothetical protein